MIVIHDPKVLQQTALELRAQGKKIALVPTMGNLHAGHASLMDIARPLADVLIVSVFVNPTQFGPNEDYDKYPRTLEADKQVCEAHGVNIVFAPANESIYFPDASTFVNEHACSQGLCGRSRPIHFRGVCTVVNLLFNLAQPNVAVFGQKDAQQVAVLKRMVRDLHIPVEMVVGPIVRESDGLALSSRNQYLTARERAAAPQINAELQALADLAKTESDSKVLAKHFMDALGQDAVFEPEYIEIVNNSTMLPADKIEAGNTLVAVAVRMTESRTRLIDNIVL
ncbi:MAG: pantoate--beta-alanine ligase [Opitutales bacterium]|nr:pantoate--beta-alanine ligase [Opitutales bacterium]